MAIPNPNPNIADGIKSDNKTYSSNKIESLIKTATELPIPEAGDAGKVLAVDDELGYELLSPVDPSVLIDDTASATTTTYSSDKIDTLLSDKQNYLSMGDISADGDMDNITTSGYYRAVAGVANRPVTQYGLVEVIQVTSTFILQRFTAISGTTELGQVYQRYKTSTGWSGWYLITATAL